MDLPMKIVLNDDDQRETSIVSLHFIQFHPTVEYTVIKPNASCMYRVYLYSFKNKVKVNLLISFWFSRY